MTIIFYVRHSVNIMFYSHWNWDISSLFVNMVNYWNYDLIISFYCKRHFVFFVSFNLFGRNLFFQDNRLTFSKVQFGSRHKQIRLEIGRKSHLSSEKKNSPWKYLIFIQNGAKWSPHSKSGVSKKSTFFKLALNLNWTEQTTSIEQCRC